MWNLKMLLLLAFVALAGCTDTGIEHGMENQPKVKPMAESDFFPDGRGARPQVPGTVARGHLQSDVLFYTGKVHGRYADVFPFPVTREVLERGHERYDIFCAVCHDRVGTGNGMIVRRGFSHPPSYHTERLRDAPVGHFFDVITNGYGAMYSYNDRIPVNDRWAIIAYIRALQFSQHAALTDLPEKDRADVEKSQ
jgi:hypothetical protein